MSTHTRATTVPCPTCGAPTGTHCRTRTGRRATWPHVERDRPLREQWTDGYLEADRSWAQAVLDATAPDAHPDALGRLVRMARRTIPRPGVQ